VSARVKRSLDKTRCGCTNANAAHRLKEPVATVWIERQKSSSEGCVLFSLKFYFLSSFIFSSFLFRLLSRSMRIVWAAAISYSPLTYTHAQTILVIETISFVQNF